jgi:hypothetical protein
MPQKCIKCKRLDRLYTCHGCQQSFCDEHTTEHREELSHQMDNINKDYRVFEEDLNDNILIQPYLSHIDQWEHQSINKIQKTAEIARNDLLKILDRVKNQFKTSSDQINQNRKLKKYTEIDLNQWMEELKQLRHLYKTSFTDDMINANQSSIPLIKIIDKNQSSSIESVPSLPPEKFDKIVGAITLSKDRLTAICSGSHWNGSDISGTNLYSSGVHSVRFRITKTGKNNPFFGITSPLKDTNPWNRKTPFAFGWWEIPFNPDEKKLPENPNIESGDEVTLTLDCLNNQIQFEHHRTNRYIEETITNAQCTLPWRIAIVLYTPGDSVSIVSA